MHAIQSKESTCLYAEKSVQVGTDVELKTVPNFLSFVTHLTVHLLRMQLWFKLLLTMLLLLFYFLLHVVAVVVVFMLLLQL
jgi:hypothetical protein